MKQHTLAALLGILLGLTACAIATELANVAQVALRAKEAKVEMMDESGLTTNVMDY